jgi:hypothetical protein
LNGGAFILFREIKNSDIPLYGHDTSRRCIDFTETLFMRSRRLILRHALVSLSFVLLYGLLNRPEVILLSRLGFITWYPAIGLAIALLLGVSPRYALLVWFADALAGRVVYGEPFTSFGNTFGAAGSALCYAPAAALRIT